MNDLLKNNERYETLLEILDDCKISDLPIGLTYFLNEEEKYITKKSIVKAIDLYLKEKKFFNEAHSWRCECGQVCDPMSGLWRWQGEYWEHHHGYPIGHVRANKLVYNYLITKND